MKNISQWASQHAPFAIALIILCEVINGVNGVVLGAAWFNTLPVAALHLGVALLIGVVMGIRIMARSGGDNFRIRRWYLLGAFFSNFLLFGLLGGLMAPRSGPHDVPTGAWGSRRIEKRASTLIRADSLPATKPAVISREGRRSDETKDGRLGYVLLFLLSLPLMYVSTGLACSLSCSGYGFFAAIVLVLGLGFLAGGIYFLGRASKKQPAKLRDMTPAERRRTGRRFWLSWGILTGIFALLLLISAIAS